MQTRTGKRTAHLQVQIVQDSPTRLTLYFSDPRLKPLAFSKSSVPPRHWDRLTAALNLSD